MVDTFIYLPEWRVLLCKSCGYCLSGALSRAQLELFGSYELRAAEDVTERSPTKAITGLRLLNGFQCLTCTFHLTRDIKAMQRHVSNAHQQMPTMHKKSPLWRACKLQTFFAENRWVEYFVVDDDDVLEYKDVNVGRDASNNSEEQAFFKRLDDDAVAAAGDAKNEANTVHGFNRNKSAVVPWLRRTSIEEHTRGLQKDEMRASFMVPIDAASEPELFLMVDVMGKIFLEAHSWCVLMDRTAY